MGKSRPDYVARAVPGLGWRIWNTRAKRCWGEVYREFPEALLAELNGLKRPERLMALTKALRR